MITPFVKKISQCEGYSSGGTTFLLEEEAETLSSNYVRIHLNDSTPVGYHDDEEELYIVTGGRARLELGDQVHEIEAGDVVFIPRNTHHQATCISQEAFEYICVANWPDRPGKLEPRHA